MLINMTRQWTKGLNRFQNYFSCCHFETLPGDFSCTPTLEVKLITMGFKVPLEGVRQPSVVHVTYTCRTYLLFSRYNVPGKLNLRLRSIVCKVFVCKA